MKTVAELEAEIDEWIPELEVVELTQEEFDALDEYSTTIPTGKRIGKQWKRQLYYGKYSGQWVRCEYVEDEVDPENYVGMKWHRIQFKEES